MRERKIFIAWVIHVHVPVWATLVPDFYRKRNLYDRQVHRIHVSGDRKLREYIEENTWHAGYGTVSYRVGSAGPMLVST